EQIYSWMNGATMAHPCSFFGTNGYHAVYTCDLTLSSGYQARAVWNTDGNSTYTVPTQFTRYGDLHGNIYSVPTTKQVTIGHAPILLEGTASAPVNNSTLTLTSLAPSSATAGGAGFTLTINGVGFVSGAVVSWNGSGRYRTFVNSTQMKAAISAKDIGTAVPPRTTVTIPRPEKQPVNEGGNFQTSNAWASPANSG